MALNLTDALKQALSKNQIEPIFVLKFEGIPYYYSSIPLKSIPRYDDDGIFYDADDLFYDKPYINQKSKDYVIAAESSNSITQQIEPDKAGGTSASSMTFKIVDFQQELSAIISPGFTLDEFLGINCDIYQTLSDGTSFPEDSVTVMHGVVEDCSAGPGFVRVTVSHPQNLLRQDFIPPWTSKLEYNFEYKSATYLGNRYLARNVDSVPITINFINGGSVSVSVVKNTSNYVINITIISGTTTSDTIKKALEDNLDSNAIIQVESVGDTPQINFTYSGLVLGDSTYAAVLSVDGFYNDNTDTAFESYININDEILKVTSVDTSFRRIYIDNTSRGKFNSVVGVTGEVDDEVKSFYTFQGNALTLALKLMISTGSNITSSTQLWGNLPGIGLLTNAVYFSNLDVARDLGVVVGDTCTIDGIATDRQILSINLMESNSYIVLDGASIGIGSDLKTVTFKSKYNTLPIGCGIKPKFIDIIQFESLIEKYFSDIPDYLFYINESVDMKEFLESELLFPSSVYMIPRKGRISCNMTRPAVGDETLVVLNSDVILNPQTVEIGRSVNAYFYNSIKWYYNPDAIEDSFLDKSITVSADSVTRFKRGVVPLLIESKGLRPGLNSDQFIERNTRRMLDRYQNAPEYVTVTVPLGVGLPIEIGDPVLFGDNQTQITDTTKGNRLFDPRIFEVINKQQNQTNVRLKLLETNYGVNGRYGMFSPSSYLNAGSTATILRIKKSFGTSETEAEVEKWRPYIGQKVMIHNSGWTYSEDTILVGILDDNSGIEIAPAIAQYAEDYIIEPANYSDIVNDTQMSKFKALHCFFNPQVVITSSVSPIKFNVSLSDAAKFTPGCVVRIHDATYSADSGSEGIKVDSISGTEITLSKSYGGFPLPGQLVDLIGFKDGGKPYLFV